jgi:twitching motility protein PilU
LVVRDREVMEQAIYFAETGHLCIATIHASNASQTIERVLNFFPEDRHMQILLNLSLNLRATLSQRLIPTIENSHTLALEIMLNRGLIRQHIEQGKVRQLREMIEKGTSEGMQSFDQHLMELFEKRIITEQVAIAESDTPANLRMMIQSKKVGERTPELSVRDNLIARKASDF